jgi:hypothetical protein
MNDTHSLLLKMRIHYNEILNEREQGTTNTTINNNQTKTLAY